MKITNLVLSVIMVLSLPYRVLAQTTKWCPKWCQAKFSPTFKKGISPHPLPKLVKT